MTKTEFLSRLAEELKGISAEEREEALNYYSEYLDEAGEENEEAAIEELGGPEKVARIIRANTAQSAQGAQPAAPKAAAEDPFGAAAQPVPPSSAYAQGGQSAQQVQSGPAYTQSGPDDTQSGPAYAQTAPGAPHIPYEGYEAPRRRSYLWLWIILGVICIPVIIGLMGAILGLIGGVIGMLASLIIGGATAAFAGFGLIIKSVFLFSSYPAGALFMMGGGFLTGGLGVLACAFGIWLIRKGVPFVASSIRSGWSYLKGKVRDLRWND